MLSGITDNFPRAIRHIAKTKVVRQEVGPLQIIQCPLDVSRFGLQADVSRTLKQHLKIRILVVSKTLLQAESGRLSCLFQVE